MLFRSRPVLAFLFFATIALGLVSRRMPLFPAVLGKYPGDAIWAMMLYWGLAFLAPAAPVKKLALVALVISYLDEISQLYQGPWIHAIRATTIGHLILGSAFYWEDLLAYTLGIVFVACLELWWQKTKNLSENPVV